MNNISIRVAIPEDYELVYALLKEEYSNNSFFSLENDDYLREGNTRDTKILVVVEDGEIISTMRGTLLHDSTNIEHIHFPADFSNFPSLYLTRAATKKGSGKTGLNSLLRYFFILQAREKGCKSLTGVANRKMPRVNLLEQIGYRIFLFEAEHDAVKTKQLDVVFLQLNEVDYKVAIEKLQQMLVNFKDVPFTNEEELHFESDSTTSKNLK